MFKRVFGNFLSQFLFRSQGCILGLFFSSIFQFLKAGVLAIQEVFELEREFISIIGVVFTVVEAFKFFFRVTVGITVIVTMEQLGDAFLIFLTSTFSVTFGVAFTGLGLGNSK